MAESLPAGLTCRLSCPWRRVRRSWEHSSLTGSSLITSRSTVWFVVCLDLYHYTSIPATIWNMNTLFALIVCGIRKRKTTRVGLVKDKVSTKCIEVRGMKVKIKSSKIPCSWQGSAFLGKFHHTTQLKSFLYSSMLMPKGVSNRLISFKKGARPAFSLDGTATVVNCSY